MDILTKIEEYMEVNGDIVDNKIQEIVDDFEVRKIKKTEEDFKMAFIPLLNNIANDIGVTLEPLYENTVFKGRMDALYNCVDLEYKVPGAIEEFNSYPARKSSNIAYINEVKKQIKGYSQDEKIKLNQLLGIIFDGKYFIYVNYLTTDWLVDSPEPRNKYSIEKFLKMLFSLQIDNKAISVNNLVKDFGANSSIAENSVLNFYDILEKNIDKSGLNIIFEQWKSLFREVSGYSYDTTKLDLKELEDIYGFKDKEVKIDYLIFSIHTYYALLIKILVIQVLYHHKNKKSFQYVLKYETNQIAFNTMKEIESGGRYRSLGIINFLEEDFFGWYLKVWNNDIYKVCVKILKKFDEYNYDTVELNENNSRDLLKKLYNFLLPKTLRHALGEYYSPDWIAQHTYNIMNINGNLDKSILDPTCGSGTFIVIAIKEMIKTNKDLNKKELLKKIINNVHGFDLNPLAVIAARANYIIALGDLLDETEDDIEIPIFHCDAMLTILEQEKGNQIIRKLATRAGVFEIPMELSKDKNQFYMILDEFNNTLESKKEFNENLWSKIENINGDIKKKSKDEINEIKALTKVFFSQIKELDEKGIRKIWIQIIKNAFAPIFHEKVDYIIGNPPWVNWQTLPEDYRDSIHRHWYDYKIFDRKGLDARLGGAHDDISVLLTYVVMDNLLKNDGELGFIINQNLLQAPAGDGFRKFMIRGEIPVRVKEVEDLVEVEPFKSLGANNKTAIILLQRDSNTVYPVPYKRWKKVNSGVIDSEDHLDLVLDKIDIESMVAEPINEKEENSSWIINSTNRLKVLREMIGNSNYVGRKGVDTSANGIYWVQVLDEIRGKYLVRNTPEFSKKKIPQTECILEKDIIYPLVRGKDLKKWRCETPYSIIIPYDDDFNKVLSKEEFKEEYPKTYGYFYDENSNQYSNKFIDILKNRAIYKKHYKNTPEHVLYNIGKYTKSPYKVIWKTLQGKGMNACVISSKNNKLIIPDHNNILVSIDNEKEAHYLCAILNSKIVEEFVDSYISWYKSTHILNNINIPKFDPEDNVHVELANKSIQAHNICSEEKINKGLLKTVEEEIDNLVIKSLLSHKDIITESLHENYLDISK